MDNEQLLQYEENDLDARSTRRNLSVQSSSSTASYHSVDEELPPDDQEELCPFRTSELDGLYDDSENNSLENRPANDSCSTTKNLGTTNQVESPSPSASVRSTPAEEMSLEFDEISSSDSYTIQDSLFQTASNKKNHSEMTLHQSVEEDSIQTHETEKSEPTNAVLHPPSKPHSGIPLGGVDIADIVAGGDQTDIKGMLAMMLRQGTAGRESIIKRAVEGIRVVRGPDWDSHEQDKGEGQVGTVRIMKEVEGIVQVAWDHGGTNDYYSGHNGKHELRILDNAQVGVRHATVTCDGCNEKGIWGMRWKCQICPDFDLCTECYMKDRHMEHAFNRILKPGSPSLPLSTREGQRKVKAQGLFLQARVCRGKDWKYLDRDGGMGCLGTITGITDISSSADRNGAAVRWDNGHSNCCRVGYHGYCDLRYIEPGLWGNYYPSHLPLLDMAELIGEQSGDKISADREDNDSSQVEIISGISGTRVIRGKDWQWGNQDNGPFNMGTVEGIDRGESELNTCVYWDHGFRARYRSGCNGKFDLKVVDNAPAKVAHRGVRCDGCNETPLRGIRWRCLKCSSVNLCTECYGADKHSVSHSFGHVMNPDSSDLVKVPPRQDSQRAQLQGIFLGATVVRGPDWRWGEQDGKAGTSGRVVKQNVPEKHEKAAHCWFHVKWHGKRGANAYRLGADACIDMKAIEPAMGYHVYPDHLPDFATTEFAGKPENEQIDALADHAGIQTKTERGNFDEMENESDSILKSRLHTLSVRVEGPHDKFRIRIRPRICDIDRTTWQPENVSEGWKFSEWVHQFQLSERISHILSTNRFTDLLSLAALSYFRQRNQDVVFFDTVHTQISGPQYCELTYEEIERLDEGIKWISELLQRHNLENPLKCHSALSRLIEQQLRESLQVSNPYQTLQIMRENPAEYEVRKKMLHGGQLATVCFGVDVLSPADSFGSTGYQVSCQNRGIQKAAEESDTTFDSRTTMRIHSGLQRGVGVGYFEEANQSAQTTQELASSRCDIPEPPTCRLFDNIETWPDFYHLCRLNFFQMYPTWYTTNSVIFLPPQEHDDLCREFIYMTEHMESATKDSTDAGSQLESSGFTESWNLDLAIHYLISQLLVTIGERAFVIYQQCQRNKGGDEGMIEGAFKAVGAVLESNVIVFTKLGILLMDVKNEAQKPRVSVGSTTQENHNWLTDEIHSLVQLENITRSCCAADEYFAIRKIKTVYVVPAEFDLEIETDQNGPFVLSNHQIKQMTTDMSQAMEWWKSLWYTEKEQGCSEGEITLSGQLDQHPSVLPLLVGLKCHQTNVGFCYVIHSFTPSKKSAGESTGNIFDDVNPSQLHSAEDEDKSWKIENRLSRSHCHMLTPEQVKVWNGGNRQILSGVPGSGKTVLIQCKALELLWLDHHPVLMLLPWHLVQAYSSFFETQLYQLCGGRKEEMEEKLKNLRIISFGSPFERMLQLDSGEMCFGLFDGLQSMFDEEFESLAGHHLFIDDLQSLLAIALKKLKNSKNATSVEFSTISSFLFHKLIPLLLSSREESYHWYNYSSWASESGFHTSNLYAHGLGNHKLESTLEQSAFFRSCTEEDSMIRKELNNLVNKHHFAHWPMESCCRSTTNIQHVMSHCQPSDGWVQEWELGHPEKGPKVRIFQNSDANEHAFVIHAVSQEIEYYKTNFGLSTSDIKIIDVPALGANLLLLGNYLKGNTTGNNYAYEEDNYLYFDYSYTFDDDKANDQVTCAFASIVPSHEYTAVIMLVNFSLKDRSLDHFHINSMHKNMFTAASRALYHLSVVLVDGAEKWKSHIQQCEECESACEFITVNLSDMDCSLVNEVDQMRTELDEMLDSTNTHYWALQLRNTVSDAFKLANGLLSKIELDRDDYNNLLFSNSRMLPQSIVSESGNSVASSLQRYVAQNFINAASNLTVLCSGLGDIETAQESFKHCKELDVLYMNMQVDVRDLIPEISIIKRSTSKMHHQLYHEETVNPAGSFENIRAILLRYYKSFSDHNPVQHITKCLQGIKNIQVTRKDDDDDDSSSQNSRHRKLSQEWHNLVQKMKDQLCLFVKCCTLQVAVVQCVAQVPSTGCEAVDRLINQLHASNKSDDPAVVKSMLESFLESITSSEELRKFCDFLQNQSKEMSFGDQNISTPWLLSLTAEISSKVDQTVSAFTENVQRFNEMASSSAFANWLQNRRKKSVDKLHQTFVKWQKMFARSAPYLASVLGYLAYVIHVIEKHLLEEHNGVIQTLKDQQHKSENLLRAIVQTFLVKFSMTDELNEWDTISPIATLQLNEHVLNLLVALNMPVPQMRVVHPTQVSLLNVPHR